MNTTNLLIAFGAFFAGKAMSEGGPPAQQQPALAPARAPRTVALDANLPDRVYTAVLNCFQRATAPEQCEQFGAALAQDGFPIASLMLQRRGQQMRQEQAARVMGVSGANAAVQAAKAPEAQAPAQVAAKPKPNPNADVSTSLLKMLSDMTPELYEAQASLWEPDQRRELEALMLSKGLNPPKAKPKAETAKPELPEAKPNGLAQELGSAMPQPVHAALPTEAPKS